MRRDISHPLTQEVYPYASEYYHELNPYFLLNIHRQDLFDFCKVITVRDGAIPFASFIAKSFQFLDKLETGFIIHPELARFVPDQLHDRFCAWKISQPKKLELKDAKKVLVAGLMNEECLGSWDMVDEKIAALRMVPMTVEIEFFLPIRKSPLEAQWTEFYTGYEVVERLRKQLPGRPLKFITAKQLTDSTSMKGTYFMDLFHGIDIIADKGLSHFIACRGGHVAEFALESPKDSMFELDISFGHKLHVVPLPKVPSMYKELIFFRKLNPQSDLITDRSFHKIILGK